MFAVTIRCLRITSTMRSNKWLASPVSSSRTDDCRSWTDDAMPGAEAAGRSCVTTCHTAARIQVMK